MIYFVLAGLSGVIFSSLLIYFRASFFRALEASLSLSNAVLSSEDDLIKQKSILRALKKMILSLGIVLGAIGLIFGLTLAPLWLYGLFINTSFGELDMASWQFLLSLSIGSVIPFILKKKNANEDYSEASKLLHRLILNNYNISKTLFTLDKRFKKEEVRTKNEFLIISGLARAGTTSLTGQLFKSGNFSSLDYSNMPFLLAPNLWKKIYNPKDTQLKERKHGDKVKFGFNTVEALEEYFFKAFLNDAYISESYLERHTINDEIYRNYLKYQTQIRKNNASVYLAKNNNTLLRYETLREKNKDFKIVFMFREPLAHADSLLNQHKRFIKLQNQDDFVEIYMNWLGHHEFGNNQKSFKLGDTVKTNPHPKTSLNFWLEVWINYYDYLISLENKNFDLIEYDDYLNMPKQVIRHIGNRINLKLDTSHIEPFKNKRSIDTSDCDEELLNRVNLLYRNLQAIKNII